jgi:uncharacterized protein (TIGR00288 family)
MYDTANIAIFCDYENIAIGVRDANLDHFNISLALERLLDKGKIVVKKAYSDWDRYKSHKRKMHEAAFELIEIPHVSYSGKNSADIRLVVDALDLCYTKAHVDTFVIMSGDSDFSPLVSKLRENNKKVIGMGVKNSSSDLLIDNCDEFIYYDDLVRKKAGQKGKSKAPRKGDRPKAADEAKRDGSVPATQVEAAESEDKLKEQALEMVLDVVEALFQERDGNLFGSMVKQTLKRRRPNFDETTHGYRTFSQLLEDAKRRGLLEIHRDDKSGGYVISGFGPKA